MPLKDVGAYANDFNPRTHEECDLFRRDLNGLQCISIHALTRSATKKV